mgnify:FL=1
MAADEDHFRNLNRRAAEVIETVTNSKLKYDKKEKVIDMCKAIQDMRAEERTKGQQEGKKIGQEKGKQENAKETAARLYEMGIDMEKIAKGVGYPEETVKVWLGL